MTVWAPVYEDVKGNQMIILNSHYVGETKEEADRIVIGTMLVECIILRIKAVRVQEFDLDNLPHLEAYLPNHGGHFPIKVAVIGGPEFDATPS
jgi:hypothetical protein